jgi:hypothetical protein
MAMYLFWLDIFRKINFVERSGNVDEGARETRCPAFEEAKYRLPGGGTSEELRR